MNEYECFEMVTQNGCTCTLITTSYGAVIALEPAQQPVVLTIRLVTCHDAFLPTFSF